MDEHECNRCAVLYIQILNLAKGHFAKKNIIQIGLLPKLYYNSNDLSIEIHPVMLYITQVLFYIYKKPVTL